MSIAERVRLRDERLLSDLHFLLKVATFDYRRSDGQWQTLVRESYDHGNGATILLYNLAQRSVVLTRQFRWPAFVNGHDGMLVEAPAGLLDALSPEDCIRAEAEQEAGYRVREPRQVLEAFMSPGSVTERLHLFVAEYEPGDRIGHGGGVHAEGEDIEVFELPFDEALAMLGRGEIKDGKTIMLLQYAALHLFAPTVAR